MLSYSSYWLPSELPSDCGKPVLLWSAVTTHNSTPSQCHTFPHSSTVPCQHRNLLEFSKVKSAFNKCIDLVCHNCSLWEVCHTKMFLHSCIVHEQEKSKMVYDISLSHLVIEFISILYCWERLFQVFFVTNRSLFPMESRVGLVCWMCWLQRFMLVKKFVPVTQLSSGD